VAERTTLNVQREAVMGKNYSGYDDSPLSTFLRAGHQHEKEVAAVKLSTTTYRRHHGIYYTPYSIAKKIFDDLFKLDKNLSIKSTFLDPCSGHGIFIIAYIDLVVEKFKLSKQTDFQDTMDRIYYADIDPTAIKLLRASIPLYIKEKYGHDVSLKLSNSYLGNSLYDNTGSIIKKVDLRKVFNKPEGFDIVATNPPYRLLKATSKGYGDEEGGRHREELKKLIHFLRAEKHYPLNEGTLNLYKLFTEEIVKSLVNAKGSFGLLVPQTLLNDKQSSDLRRSILEFKLSPIHIIPETNSFFADISQAFCFFGGTKASRNGSIEVISNVSSEDDLQGSSVSIPKIELAKISEDLPIIAQHQEGWALLEKIHRFPSIKNLPQLKNLRGELDLTLDKKAISRDKTNWQLARGSNIGPMRLKPLSEYVSAWFVGRTPKQKYLREERIACQQIANIHANKRIKFAMVPAGIILANSCNFVAFGPDSLWGAEPFSLKYLLGILNSPVIEWRFRLTSSNNHVSNYEIGDLPIPVPSINDRKEIEDLLDAVDDSNNIRNVNKLNDCIYKLYGLDKEEIAIICGSTNLSTSQGQLL